MNNSVSGTGTSRVAIFLLDFIVTLKGAAPHAPGTFRAFSHPRNTEGPPP